jgi:hypothetical protein
MRLVFTVYSKSALWFIGACQRQPLPPSALPLLLWNQHHHRTRAWIRDIMTHTMVYTIYVQHGSFS